MRPLAKCVCIFLLCHAAHSKIIEKPEDTEGVLGSRVILRCQTDTGNPIEWHYTADDNSPFRIIYKWKHVLKGFQHRMAVESSDEATGKYDLIIENVTLSDAGAYTCLDDQSQHKAELIVFDKYPSAEFCSVKSPPDGFIGKNDCGIVSDPLEMNCNVSYRGNLLIEVEWFNSGSVIPSTSSTTNGTMTSGVRLEPEQIQSSEYNCRIKYKDSTITSNLIWSTNVTVQSITNITTTVNEKCDVGFAECSATNNYDCLYTWIDDNGTVFTNGPLLNLTDRLQGSYVCLASCQIRRKTCSYIAKQINYNCDISNILIRPPEEVFPLAIYFIIGVLLVAFAILTSILIFFLKRSRGRHTRKSSSGSEEKSLVAT